MPTISNTPRLLLGVFRRTGSNGDRLGRIPCLSPLLPATPAEAAAMNVTDRRTLILAPGVLAEAMLADDTRLVLWLPGDRDPAYQHWQRVGAVAHAPVTVAHGLCSTPATAMPARQLLRGFFGK